METRPDQYSLSGHVQRFLAEPVKLDSQRRDCFGYTAASSRDDINQSTLLHGRVDSQCSIGRWTECHIDSDYLLYHDGLTSRGADDKPDCEHFQEGQSVFIPRYKRQGE